MISEYDKEVFDALTSGKYNNWILIETKYREKPCVIICTENPVEGSEEVDIKPLYLGITDEIFEDLMDPQKALDQDIAAGIEPVPIGE